MEDINSCHVSDSHIFLFVCLAARLAATVRSFKRLAMQQIFYLLCGVFLFMSDFRLVDCLSWSTRDLAESSLTIDSGRSVLFPWSTYPDTWSACHLIDSLVHFFKIKVLAITTCCARVLLCQEPVFLVACNSGGFRATNSSLMEFWTVCFETA